jgi:hypothetical protein
MFMRRTSLIVRDSRHDLLIEHAVFFQDSFWEPGNPHAFNPRFGLINCDRTWCAALAFAVMSRVYRRIRFGYRREAKQVTR